MFRLLLPIVAFLLLAACTPDLAYPPPPQKVMPPGDEPPMMLKPLLKMSDLDADGSILDGMAHASPGEPTRWTNQHPRFRLWLDSTQGWEFYMHLQIAGQILQDVGPQTVAITINGKPLGAPRYDKSDLFEYSHPVPPEMLTPNGPTILGLDIDPIWIAPGDGARLGVLLMSIGFRKAGHP